MDQPDYKALSISPENELKEVSVCWSEFCTKCYDNAHTQVRRLTSTPHSASCSNNNTVQVKISTNSPLLLGKSPHAGPAQPRWPLQPAFPHRSHRELASPGCQLPTASELPNSPSYPRLCLQFLHLHTFSRPPTQILPDIPALSLGSAWCAAHSFFKAEDYLS